jgi:hypothetical protein
MSRLPWTILNTGLTALLIFGATTSISFAASARSANPQEPNATKRNDRPQDPSAPQRREDNKKPPDPTRYSYEFTQPDFYNRHILIEHDATGRGKITFERQNQPTPISEPIELSVGALGRILGLWSELQFLDSTENYQSTRQYAHLGTMRIRMDNGARNRTAEFNWTNNRLAAALTTEYKRVADQAIFIFDIGVAREIQPLNTPKLMDVLEGMLNRNDLSDPRQLVPLLKDLRTDAHIPLIARNHAERLLTKIQR